MRRLIISGALVLIDTAILLLVPFISLAIRFEGIIEQKYVDMLLRYLPVALIIRLVTFYCFGLYHRLWRYASVHELLMIGVAVTVSSIIIVGYTMFQGIQVPRSLHLINWLLNLLLIGASRMTVRVLAYIRQLKPSQTTRVLIIGAGDAGAMIAREIKQRYHDTKTLVGFVDDATYKQNQMIYGAKVLGTRLDVGHVVIEHQINEIIIAMPSVSGKIIREIISDCKNTGCVVKIVPGVYELIEGQVTVQQLREVQIEDLLGRDSVHLDIEQITEYLRNKRVLITGAGGSIGSEICRQIAKVSPKQMLLLGKGENSIYEIDRELRAKYQTIDFIPVVADVRDKDRIGHVFQKYQPQVIFHAAAHKHVPLMEAQPEEAVRNNIFGTKIMAEAADRYKAEIFIMISTDKAVNPTSVMGATKRVAELIIQHMNSISETKYAAVRFGNVLGSRGSVIPLFKKQIAAGGPITITHPDMIRYFMTIPEATQLVLQAGALASGSEVFVLDMGDPVKIVDMAVDLIKLSGLRPHEDIELKFTGLRPGEKLFEELLSAEEGTAATKHEKIYVANLRLMEKAKLEEGLYRLQQAQKSEEIIAALEAMLPTYQVAREKYCHSA